MTPLLVFILPLPLFQVNAIAGRAVVVSVPAGFGGLVVVASAVVGSCVFLVMASSLRHHCTIDLLRTLSYAPPWERARPLSVRRGLALKSNVSASPPGSSLDSQTDRSLALGPANGRSLPACFQLLCAHPMAQPVIY